MNFPAAVLGALLESNCADLPPNLARLLAHAPESFDDDRHGRIAVAIRELKRQGRAVHPGAIAEAVQIPDATVLLMQVAQAALPEAIAEVEAETLWESFRQRKLKSVFGEAASAMEADPTKADLIASGVRRTLDALEQQDGAQERAAILEQRQFNPGIEPPPLRAVYTLAGAAICTPGNLATITSAIKTGKSAVIGAMAAAAMPHGDGADLLGFESSNPRELALLWFDSEQSPDDFWHCVHRALRRAGLPTPPTWMHAYCLTGLGAKCGWELVTEATRISAGEHGGIHSILLDGTADFVLDVNDAGESNAYVATLHDLAIRHDCPIVGVIHWNPGGEKSRGHLGSQLERKAETNLALEKDADETTVIYSTKNRRAGILKHLGPRFAFSVQAGMHVSVQTHQASKDELERQTLTVLAEDLFLDRPSMRYSDLESTVKTRLTVSPRTAERKVARMRQLGVIKKSAAGLYTLGN